MNPIWARLFLFIFGEEGKRWLADFNKEVGINTRVPVYLRKGWCEDCELNRPITQNGLCAICGSKSVDTMSRNQNLSVYERMVQQEALKDRR